MFSAHIVVNAMAISRIPSYSGENLVKQVKPNFEIRQTVLVLAIAACMHGPIGHAGTQDDMPTLIAEQSTGPIKATDSNTYLRLENVNIRLSADVSLSSDQSNASDVDQRAAKRVETVEALKDLTQVELEEIIEYEEIEGEVLAYYDEDGRESDAMGNPIGIASEPTHEETTTRADFDAVDSATAAVLAKNGGRIIVVGGSIESPESGAETQGLSAESGGDINASGTTIDMGGQDSIGVLALADTSPATVTLNDAKVQTSGASTSGVLTQGTDAKIRAQNSNIHVNGNDSSGISAVGGGSIELGRVTVVAGGNNSDAAIVSSGSKLIAWQSTLRSEQSDGIALIDSGAVTLMSSIVEAHAASFYSSLETAGQEQTIIVNGKSQLTANNGVLLQVNRSSEGMDGVVHLILGKGVVARGDVNDVVELDKQGQRVGSGMTHFHVGDGAEWSGQQRGLRNIYVGHGAKLIETGGTPLPGVLSGGQDSVLSFTKGADIGGNVTLAPGNKTSFTGKTSIGGTVTATRAELAFHDAARIGGDLVGNGAHLAFGQRDRSTIAGDLLLSNSARLDGGSIDKPLRILGNVTVSSQAVLSGNLSATGALNAAGGTLSPGNSIGKQTFGSITHLGDRYIAEVNAAGQSDLIVAHQGDIDVSATNLSVAQENGDGGYRLDHDYTILQASNGNIIGEFASAALDTSFDNTLVRLAPVAYQSQEVQIRLLADAEKITEAASTLNDSQQATLQAVASMAGTNETADATLLSQEVKSALNQLSGEIHATTQSALLYAGNQLRQTLSERARSGFASTASSVPLWAHASGGEFTLKGDQNASKARTQSGGIVIGGDGEVGQGWRLGAAIGYTNSSTKAENRGSAKGDANSYTGALYAGKTLERKDGQFDVLTGAAYTHHNIDTRRHITVGSDQTLKGHYNAKSAQVFAEASYGAHVGTNGQIGPYVGLAWMNLKSGRFNESGGSAAMRGDARHDDVLITTLGVRGKTHFDLGSAQAFIRGGLGWRHATGDVTPARSMRFAANSGATLRVTGAPIAKDAAAVNLEFGANVGKTTTVGLSYNGQFGRGLVDNNGTLFMKVGF